MPERIYKLEQVTVPVAGGTPLKVSDFVTPSDSKIIIVARVAIWISLTTVANAVVDLGSATSRIKILSGGFYEFHQVDSENVKDVFIISVSGGPTTEGAEVTHYKNN